MAEQSNSPTSPAAARRAAGSTKRSTAAKKAAATRSRRQTAETRRRTTAARKAAETRRELAKTPVDRVQEAAERVVLVQVGAALVARDNLVAAADGLRTTLTTREGAEKRLAARRKRLEAELKRFERRGRSERIRLEREVHKARTRVERDLRGVTEQADLLSARAQNVVQTGVTRGTQAATAVQERVSRGA